MKAIHRKYLTGFRDYHTHGISLKAIYLRAWRTTVLLLAYFGIASALAFLYGYTIWGALLGGFGLGALARDLSQARTTVAVWPLLDRIIDWKQVEELAEPSASEGSRL